MVKVLLKKLFNISNTMREKVKRDMRVCNLKSISVAANIAIPARRSRSAS